MPAERSSSGAWSRGQTFVPKNGVCAGHLVHIVNPEIELFVRMPAIIQGKKVMLRGKVPAVLVRCQADQRSWSFPEEARVDEDGLEVDVEVTRAKVLAMLLEQNGIQPPDLPDMGVTDV